MGHGASTSVKKVALVKEGDNLDQRTVWIRSNSDGCIVENLNTSKTKVDLLNQQLSEYKELLRAAEEKHEEVDQKAKLLEKQMAEVEGANFELMDRVSELEQQLESLQSESTSEVNDRLEQELLLSNQQVEKLEMHMKLLEEQMASMRSTFRKKLRTSKTEVAEAKQESALKVYSLKDEIKQLEEENVKLTERFERLSSSSQGASKASHMEKDRGVVEDSRTMVILELSSQVSTQEDRIMELEELLNQKDKLISDLTNRLSQQRPPSRPLSGNNVCCSSGRSRNGTQRSAKAQRHTGSTNQFDDFHDDDGDLMFHSSSTDRSVCVNEHRNDNESGSREGSAKNVGVDDSDDDRQTRQRRSSRNRRHNDSLRDGERVRSIEVEKDNKKSTPKSLDSKKDRRIRDAKERRTHSSSKDGRKDEVHRESSGNMNQMTPYEIKAEAASVEANIGPCGGVKSRVSSAGSHDSASHHYTEEGTKSAPSSAGSRRHRRRLKAMQQRAASLDTLTDRDANSHKHPLQTSTMLPNERNSQLGLSTDDNHAKVSSKSAKPTDSELDDMLLELMSDSPTDETHKDGCDRHKQKFGISEDKIRSLMSDHNKNDVTST